MLSLEKIWAAENDKGKPVGYVRARIEGQDADEMMKVVAFLRPASSGILCPETTSTTLAEGEISVAPADAESMVVGACTRRGFNLSFSFVAHTHLIPLHFISFFFLHHHHILFFSFIQ